MKVFLVSLLVAALCLNNIFAAPDKVVCYYGSWATYRSGNGKFNVEKIDTSKCTHIIYSFVGLNSDGSIKILDSWNDIDLGAFKRFNDLKQKNRNLKTLVAIGGWNEGSVVYSNVFASASLRTQFIKNAIAFMESWGFDGFDLDWEYPAQRGGNEYDKANFAKLVKEFREKFDSTGRRYLLTAAVGATGTAADASYDVPALSRYLDFINLMTYDFHGSYDGVTGQNSPLYGSSFYQTENDQQKNVAASVTAWLQRGATPDKIVLGLAVYGRTFTLSNINNNGLGAAISGGGNKGPYTGEASMLGYNEICEMQKGGGWTEIWDNEQKVPYIYKGNQWIGFDNPRSIKMKVDYARFMNLGGVMIWSIETDDFNGICGPKFPILTAINEAMGSTRPPESSTQTWIATTPPPIGSIGNQCTQQGFMRDSNNCQVFYQCVSDWNGGFTKYRFSCSAGLVFDTALNVCNYAHSVVC